jgi:hypothetical protein
MMSTEEDDIVEVLALLDAAFGDLEVPPDDRIVYDNSGHHLECIETRAKFRRRHWRNLSNEDLAGEADSLCFLTPEAFRFYLPAFIRAALLDPLGADLIPDSILSKFARANNLSLTKHNEELLTTFGRLGFPEEVSLDLLAHAHEESDELKAARWDAVKSLTAAQKHAVLGFVIFLKNHRSEEYGSEELDRAEKVLRSGLPSDPSSAT